MGCRFTHTPLPALPVSWTAIQVTGQQGAGCSTSNVSNVSNETMIQHCKQHLQQHVYCWSRDHVKVNKLRCHNWQPSPEPCSLSQKAPGYLSASASLPYAPSGYGAPRGRRLEALDGGMFWKDVAADGRQRSEGRARRGAPRRS